MTDQQKSENRCDGVGHQWINLCKYSWCNTLSFASHTLIVMGLSTNFRLQFQVFEHADNLSTIQIVMIQYLKGEKVTKLLKLHHVKIVWDY